MQLVKVIKGRYSVPGNLFRDIINVTFPAVDCAINTNDKGKFIIVDGTPIKGYPKRGFKVFIDSATDFTLFEGELDPNEAAKGAAVRVPMVHIARASSISEVDSATLVEHLNGPDDELIKARIEERFHAMHYLVKCAAEGSVRGIVVSGPPGVGKSYGVERALLDVVEHRHIEEKLTWEPSYPGEQPPEVTPESMKGEVELRFKFISGHVTPAALYEILHGHSDEKSVLVFDDCDSVLLEEDSLNFLKKALDTTAKERILQYHTTGNRISAPSRFLFKGSIVFISNINFDSPKRAMSSIAEHLDAIQSRVYYVDLAIGTLREKYLWIEKVCADSGLLENMGLEKAQVKEVMSFFKKNIAKFREVSIRTVEKIGKLALINNNWVRTAELTLFGTLALIDQERAEAKAAAEAAEREQQQKETGRDDAVLEQKSASNARPKRGGAVVVQDDDDGDDVVTVGKGRTRKKK